MCMRKYKCVCMYTHGYILAFITIPQRIAIKYRLNYTRINFLKISIHLNNPFLNLSYK